jgi:hypothetical protein
MRLLSHQVGRIIVYTWLLFLSPSLSPMFLTPLSALSLSRSPSPNTNDSPQLGGVIDFSGDIECTEFVAAGGSGQIYKGRWVGMPSAGDLDPQQKIAVKVVILSPLRDEVEKDKRFKVSICSLCEYVRIPKLSWSE